MSYSAAHIASVIAPKAVLPQPGAPVRYLLTDSRHLLQPADTLFFALPGPRRNGATFISNLYEQGVRSFVVSAEASKPGFEDANFFVVPDVLQALQVLATHHRMQFNLPVIGITGSNGKTIVKEWLYQLLQDQERICRSPRSYNSQVGVPLSVWQLAEEHTLGIFEAGISQPGEMQHLHNIIQPNIGVFTNLGEAHSAGFGTAQEKCTEKAALFEGVAAIITQDIYSEYFPGKPLFTWGRNKESNVVLQDMHIANGNTVFTLIHSGNRYHISIPFADPVAQDNALTCCAVLLYLGKNLHDFKDHFARLHAVDMRLQMFDGINGCNIVYACAGFYGAAANRPAPHGCSFRLYGKRPRGSRPVQKGGGSPAAL
jgi:alanine racemase